MHALQITDIVTAPGRGTFGEDIKARVAGFYRETRSACGQRSFRPCLVDHPDLALIDAVHHCSLLLRPWQVVYHGPTPFSAAMIATERARWTDALRNAPCSPPSLLEQDYPNLFAAHPHLSSHDRLRIAAWRQETSDRIAAQLLVACAAL